MNEGKERRNPDILETIADLSNDEVFTPPKLANDVLDMLPKELWSDSSVTFLDPAVKTGIFLRAITERLIEGLADEIPDLQERVNHILTKQVFGLGITELTTLMSRRSVYCSTTANGEYSVCTEFTDVEGNIKLPNSKHDFNKDGKCEVCGANKDNYDNIDGLDNYAYSFLHDDVKEVFGDMKFDVIIGNPPYQLSVNQLMGNGVETDSAIPIYNKFVEKAKDLKPQYITMIIPSRWMKGGKGLKSFREVMINDKRISHMSDYMAADKIFPNINLDGGVCYFLWNKEHNGKVKYTYNDKDKEIHSERFLKNDFVDIVIRDPRQLSIIEKVGELKENSMENKVMQNPFGLLTDLFNNPVKYKGVDVIDTPKEGYNLVYGVKGNKGGAKRISKYIKREHVLRSESSINKYKLFLSRAFSSDATVPPTIIKGLPGTLSTQTFFKIGDFDTEVEMLNCLSYMETKFYRALFHFKRSAFHLSMDNFSLVPLQDFTKSWADEELYKKYKLTKEEIAYIEDNIDPMGDNTPEVEDLEVNLDDE